MSGGHRVPCLPPSLSIKQVWTRGTSGPRRGSRPTLPSSRPRPDPRSVSRRQCRADATAPRQGSDGVGRMWRTPLRPRHCLYRRRHSPAWPQPAVSCIDLAGATGSLVDPDDVWSFDEYDVPLIDFMAALPDGHKIPAEPPTKEPTEPIDHVLHSKVRVVRRIKFDSQVAECNSFMEEVKLERERQQKVDEEIEIKQLRKEEGAGSKSTSDAGLL